MISVKSQEGGKTECMASSMKDCWRLKGVWIQTVFSGVNTVWVMRSEDHIQLIVAIYIVVERSKNYVPKNDISSVFFKSRHLCRQS